MSHRDKPNGYRYVREQRRWYCDVCGALLPANASGCTDCGLASNWQVGSTTYMRQWWALYEVRDGRARRVGTARSEGDAGRFLTGNDPTTTVTTTEGLERCVHRPTSRS